jgi:thiamine transport system permease protein
MGKNNLKIIFLIPLIFFIFFLIYPITSILIYSIQNIELTSLIELIFNSRTVLINSFTQAIASTFFSLILGLSAGYLISKYEFKGRKLLELSSFIPFILPSVFVVLAMILFYGNNGIINEFLSLIGLKINFLYGFTGIILAHSFYNFPIIMRFTSNALNELNENELNAGKMLGANKLQRFLKIELPSIMPSIISSSLLVFIYCFTSFAIVLSLGGAKYANFEVKIYQTIMHSLNLPQGIILALIQFILLSGIIFLYLNYSKKITSKKEISIKRKKIKLNSIKGIILSIISLLFLIFVFAPILLVIFSSLNALTNQGIEIILNNFFQGNIFQAIINSLFFGLSSALISVMLSLLLVFGLKEKAEKTSIAFLSITAISSISLATGYWLSFGTGNPLLIIIAHAIISFPFVFRILLISFNKINKELIQASRTLGANELQSIILIQLPLMKKAILAGFGFAFAISLGELGLTLMLFDGKWITLSVLMYRLISAHKMNLAAVIGTIILLIDFLLIYLIQKKGDKNCLK